MFNPNMDSEVVWVIPIYKCINWGSENMRWLRQGWWSRSFGCWGHQTQPVPHLHESWSCCISLSLKCTLLYLILFLLCQNSVAVTGLCSDFTAVRSPAIAVLATVSFLFWFSLSETVASQDKSWQMLVVSSPSCHLANQESGSPFPAPGSRSWLI